jgi:cell division septum initiation protein DivIVA
MNSDKIVREVSRIADGLEELVRALVTELTMHEELIARLEKRLTELYAQGSQAGVKGYNATDLGNMVSEIQTEGLLDDYIDQRISEHPEVIGEGIVRDIARREAEEVLSDAGHGEDDIRQWAKEEAEEVLSKASFTVTVD